MLVGVAFVQCNVAYERCHKQWRKGTREGKGLRAKGNREMPRSGHACLTQTAFCLLALATRPKGNSSNVTQKCTHECVCVRVCVWKKEVWLLVCFVRYFEHLLGVFCRVFASLAMLIAADIFYAELCDTCHAPCPLPPAPMHTPAAHGGALLLFSQRLSALATSAASGCRYSQAQFSSSCLSNN